MSRTFRNKNTVKHGWSVRDDGRMYLGTDLWGRDHGYGWKQLRMPKFRRSFYRCERGWARKLYRQQYRNKTRLLLCTGHWEAIMPPRGTCGWWSW